MSMLSKKSEFRAATSKGATPAQRNEIRRLSKLASIDTRSVTFQHRLIGVAESAIGKSVDAWLDAMTIDQASGFITRLQAIVGPEEDDE